MTSWQQILLEQTLAAVVLLNVRKEIVEFPLTHETEGISWISFIMRISSILRVVAAVNNLSVHYINRRPSSHPTRSRWEGYQCIQKFLRHHLEHLLRSTINMMQRLEWEQAICSTRRIFSCCCHRRFSWGRRSLCYFNVMNLICWYVVQVS